MSTRPPIPLPAPPLLVPPSKSVTPPAPGERITSLVTGSAYLIGDKIGEGFFGVVYHCVDEWENQLAAKIFKPQGTYESVKEAAQKELQKLISLRHPNITYVHDAFEYRDTFYIITERCHCPVSDLFQLDNFNGSAWLLPIARSLLQAINFLHGNQCAHQDIHAGNVFAAFARNEMLPQSAGAIQFKVGDLGVAKLFGEIDAANTRAEWLLPPEVLDVSEFGPIDHRIDIYHSALLLLQLAHSREQRFTRDEILAGTPRELALSLSTPFGGVLEKALRRHVPYRTQSAKQLWQELRLAATAPLAVPASEV